MNRDSLKVLPGLYDLKESYDVYMNFIAKGCEMQQSAENEDTNSKNVDVYVVTPFIDDTLEDLMAWAQGYNPDDNPNHLSPSNFLKLKQPLSKKKMKRTNIKIKLYTKKKDFEALTKSYQVYLHSLYDIYWTPQVDEIYFHCKWAAIVADEDAYVLHTSANVHRKHMQWLKVESEDFRQREFFETIEMTKDVFDKQFLGVIKRSVCPVKRNENDTPEQSPSSNSPNLFGDDTSAVSDGGEYFGLCGKGICWSQFKDFLDEGSKLERDVYVAMAPSVTYDVALEVLPGSATGSKTFYMRSKKAKNDGKPKVNRLLDYLKKNGWIVEESSPPNYFHCKWAAFSYYKKEEEKIKEEEEGRKGGEGESVERDNGKSEQNMNEHKSANTNHCVDILLTSANMIKAHMSEPDDVSSTDSDSGSGNTECINSLHRINELDFVAFETYFLKKLDFKEKE